MHTGSLSIRMPPSLYASSIVSEGEIRTESSSQASPCIADWRPKPGFASGPQTLTLRLG